MTPQRITGLFIFSVILLILLYDLFALLHWGFQGTISTVVKNCGERWPLLLPVTAFAMGALFGHFFYKQSKELQKL